MNNNQGAYLESGQEKQALLVAVGVSVFCLGVCLLLLWSGKVRFLNYFYPVTAVLLGFVLYIARSAFYVGFTFWIWFLTPFIRRLIDYQTGGFSTVSLVMLTPYLVTGISFLTILRYGKQLTQPRYLPVGFVILGVLYGYAVGVLSFGLFAASYNLLEWLFPLLLCFHILAHWREYPSHKRVVQSVFVWGVLIMGTYGVIQFMTAPPWDAHWMMSASMDSIGKPEPFRIRVFSMLNSPGPFAMVLMAGLVVLFTRKGFVARLGMAPGFAAFLLTLVRTSWGAWVVAMLFVIHKIRGPMRRRLVMLVALGAVLSVPIILIGPISDQVGERVATLGNLEEDGSFETRMGVYDKAIVVLTRPVGFGLGSLGGSAQFTLGRRLTLDSGVIAIPYVLGWPGTLFFFGGLYLMIRTIWRTREQDTDQFAIFAGGIAMAFMAALLFSNQLIGPKGIVVWSFLALALAARSYYFEQDLALELVEEQELLAEPDYV